MKKILIIITILISLIVYSTAQDYNTGIGLRAGVENGLTIKHFNTGNSSLEGIISSRWEGFSFTGLYEKHQPAFDENRLNFYYGVGGHIGFWNGDNVGWVDDDKDYTVIGVDGILGLEYNFVEIPFNVSIDWKPAFNIVGYSGLWLDGGALSIRYIF